MSALDDLLSKYNAGQPEAAPPSSLDALMEKYSSPFANVQAGSSSVNPITGVEAGVDVEYYPEVESDWKRAYLNADKNVADAFTGGLGRAAAGAVGLLAPAASAVNSVVWPSMQDAPYQAAQAMLERGTQKQQAAVGTAGFIGNVGSALAGGFLTEPMARGMETLEQGKSLAEAEKVAALQSGVNLGGAALGLPFMRAPGLLGVAKRAAVQIPGSVGLTYGERGIQGEDVTSADLAMAIGGGAFGSIFPEPPRAVKKELPDIPKTGDAAFDGGLASVMQDVSKPLDTSIDFGKIDTAAPFVQEFSDVGPKWSAIEPTPTTTNVDMGLSPRGSRARVSEQERLAVMEDAANAEGSGVTKNIQRERDAYATSAKDLQKELDNLPSQKELASQFEQQYLIEDIKVHGEDGAVQPRIAKLRKDSADANAQLALASQREAISSQMASVSDRLIRADSELARITKGNEGLTQLRRIERQEGQADIPALAVAEIPAVSMAFPEQGKGVSVGTSLPKEEFMRPSKRKLGKQSLSVDSSGNTVSAGTPSKAAKPADRSLDQMLADAKARRDAFDQTPVRAAPLDVENVRGLDGNPLLVKGAKIPSTVKAALAEGKLTGRLVLDSVLEDHNLMFTNAKEARGYAQVLKEAGDNLGGLDTSISVFDKNNPAHAAARNREPDVFDKAAAIYDPTSNSIILLNSSNMGTLVHEVGHAITEKALFMGEKNTLQGKSKEAYATLGTLFSSLKPSLLEKAAQKASSARLSRGDDAARLSERNTNYGLTNLHEFMSEMFSNPHFRSHLKDLKLDDNLKKQMGGFGRLALAKVNNAYQAVVALVRDMLGLSPKADNALDAMFSASKQFLGSLDKKESALSRELNARNTKTTEASDLSFLGEQIPSRFAPSTAETATEVQGPRSVPLTYAKALFFAKGIEPAVDSAKRMRKNISALGELKAAKAGNRLLSVTNKDNAGTVNAALNGDVEALNKLSPEAQAVVRQEVLSNYDRSLEIVDNILADPNRTPQNEAVARKILEQAGNYQTTAYKVNELPKWGKQQLAAYKTAAAKQTKGQPLSAEELATVQTFSEAKKFFTKQWLPDREALSRMELPHLEALYREHVGLNPDKQFSGWDSKDKRLAMEGSVAQKINTNTNKEGFVDKIVEAALGVGGKASTKRYYQGLRRSSDVYSTLSDTPKAVQDLWGIITDPVVKTVLSINRQYSYLANLQSQNKLRAEGMDTLFSEAANPKHTELLSGDTFGPLQGLYTTPDVKRHMDSVFMANNAFGTLLDSALSNNSHMAIPLNIVGGSMNLLRGVAGQAKAMNVLGNTGNFVLNASGSPVQLMANGNINPVAVGKGLSTMYKVVRAEKGLLEDMDVDDMYRYGQVEHSQLEELRKSAGKQRIQQILQEAEGSENPFLHVVGAANKLRKEGTELYKELYSAMDLWSKMANWHNELDFWTKYNERTGGGKTLEQIKEFVGKRNNDTNITPSMAANWVKVLESPGITQFLTYYTEVARTTKNNWLVAAQDMGDAFKGGKVDMPLLAHGTARLLGNSAAVFGHSYAFSALVGAGASALGLTASSLEDDDARKQYMETSEFWNSQEAMILSDPNNKESGEYAFDASRFNPMQPIGSPLQRLYKAVAKASDGDMEGARKEAGIAVDNVQNLFTNNSMWKGVFKAIKGQAPSSKRTAPSAYEEQHSVLTNMDWLGLKDTGFSSKDADKILSGTEAFLPKQLVNYLASKEISSKPLAMLKASGLGVTQFDATKDLGSFVGRVGKAEIQEAKASYTDLMKQNYINQPERLEAAFVSAIKDAAKPYNNMRAAINAAKEQGSSRRQIAEQLKSAGISEEMIGGLLADRKLTPRFLVAELDKDLEQDLLGSKTEDRKEAISRFKYNSQQIARLLRKYKSIDIDEL